ncbi:MAG: hypothetical protein ACI9KE_003372, partial [Polyangiales bacterium]
QATMRRRPREKILGMSLGLIRREEVWRVI